ncbi:MAG: hypothetical protein ISQ09_13910 [Rubripirellula sp.]|nr:hypothetical protein [Rubripirellula sp.]
MTQRTWLTRDTLIVALQEPAKPLMLRGLVKTSYKILGFLIIRGEIYRPRESYSLEKIILQARVTL